MTDTARPRGRHWLGVAFTDLAVRLSPAQDGGARLAPGEFDFDLVIVGSGYGGSIAAHHFASLRRPDGDPLSIAILERGREYVEGEFPAEPGDLPAHSLVRPGAGKPRGVADGLFDLRLGADVSALTGNGLGGGSLINAGVMLRPHRAVMGSGWPEALDPAELDAALTECEALLGATPLARPPQKFEALKQLDADRTRPAPITIATETKGAFEACNNCGNCATGCNFGAKRSLDAQLLADAARANARLEIFTGASVLTVGAAETVDDAPAGWVVSAVHSDSRMAKRFPEPTRIRARRVILAAGTFGSTEILMRSRSAGLAVSPMLGERFSTNGDMLAVGYGQRVTVSALSDGAGPPPGETGSGPTITGYLDCRDAEDKDEQILIEEMNVPWAIRPLFEELVTTTATLEALGRRDRDPHDAGDVRDDPFAVDPGKLSATSIYALMGDDDAEGRLELVEGSENEAADGSVASDGDRTWETLAIRWPDAGRKPLCRRQMALLDELTNRSGVGGRNLAHPAWRPLPESLAWIAPDTSGALVTVHPLGGCAMGDNGASGVVDHLGRVFDGKTDQTYDGLAVLDGAIVPRSLGTNPALTISALARRAVSHLSKEWGWHEAADVGEAPRGRELPARPRYREVTTREPVPTRIEVHERLSGEVELEGAGRCVVELTLASDPTAIDDLIRTGAKSLPLGRGSRLRIFDATRFEATSADDPLAPLEARLDEEALCIAEVEGELHLFRREASRGGGRILRAGYAWALNRGLRDLYQRYVTDPPEANGAAGTRLIAGGLALASHGGERRTLEYALTVTRVIKSAPQYSLDAGAPLRGRKVVTYGRAANPTRQLMEMQLTSMPGLLTPGTLALDVQYLARIGIPLIRIASSADLPSATLDVARLAAYMLRLVVSIHAWTFRLPDAATIGPARRLPGRLPAVPVFEQYHLPIPESLSDEGPEALHPLVMTRYANPEGEPVLCLHGYSASGTTFAHEALTPSVAEYLWREGFDVWIADLRTSPGLVTAVLPWSFETLAASDIPAAVLHVRDVTGRDVNIVAHCMGAAMLSMSVLGDDAAPIERDRMRDAIRSVILTQVGPAVVFSPANIFRAYLLGFLKHFLDLDRFDFRVNNSGRLGEQLIDRALNLLPYPEAEFYRENPLLPWQRAEFVAIRHRMDALYGRDFSLTNVGEGFLNDIDAMFGPLNLETVSQAMLFTRSKNVTDKNGRNRYVSRRRLRERWTFPTLSLHGADNGLASISTLARNRQLMHDAGVPYRTMRVEHFGHQDLWVSPRSAAEVFPVITDFLRCPCTRGTDDARLRPFVARPPYLGPILETPVVPGAPVSIRFAHHPNLPAPTAVVVAPVQREGESYRTFEPFDEHAEVVCGPVADGAGMMRLSITMPQGATRALVALVFDEHPALLDATFGDPAIEMPSSERRYAPGEDSRRIRDAVQDLLRQPARVIEPALLCETAPGGGVAIASCQYPPGPLDAGMAHAAWQSLLDRRRDGGQPPSVVLLLGDQVYVDATAGIADPVRIEDKYRLPYERWLSARPVQEALSRVPAFMMLDDHEIGDNWEAGHDQGAGSAGVKAFRRYQLDSGHGRNAAGFWGEVCREPVPVFMLNTRTDRTPRALGEIAGEMISGTQFEALESWLKARRDENRPCIVSMSSLPLPRHYPVVGGESASLALDGFDGYPSTRDRLLRFIAREQIAHVVLVSGDEHRPLYATIDLFSAGRPVSRVLSLHAAPLYAPIPFANAAAEDFIRQETLSLDGDIDAVVDATPLVGQGFSMLSFRQDGAGWRLAFDVPGAAPVELALVPSSSGGA